MAAQNHLKLLRIRRRLAKGLSWFLVFLLTFCFTVNWGHTQQPAPKPPQEWQINGIMAALDDPDPQIWRLALNKLSEYKIDELEIPPSKYQKIVELLNYNSNADVQLAAIEALGRMGEAAAAQAPQLVNLLEPLDNSYVQLAAVEALGRMGEAAAAQAPQLANLLDPPTNYSFLQQEAVKALGQMGEAAAAQAPQLVNFLENSGNPTMKLDAAEALVQMGEAAAAQAPRLVNLLETSSDTMTKRAAAEALGQMGEAAAAQAPQLVNLLKTSYSRDVQEEAVRALKQMGEAAAAQAPQLLKLLENPSSTNVSREVAEALGQMGEAAAAQAPQLVNLLKRSDDINVQYNAAEALGQMGEAAAAQAPQLGNLLESSNNKYLQKEVAYVLGQMGKAAATQAPQLGNLLEPSNSIDVQRAAAYALGKMGKDAATQAPQLVNLLESSNSTGVQLAAAYALGQMGEAAAAQAPQLVNLLEASLRDVKYAVAKALGQMGEAAAAQAPQLVNFLETTSDYSMPQVVVEALGQMGEATAAQAPQLVKIIETSDNRAAQRAAAYALGQIGEAAAAQAPQLVKIIETSNDTERMELAGKALGQMGEATKLGNLLETSDHSDHVGVELAAARALGQMGEAAAAQAPKLGNLLKTSDHTSLEQEAAKALGQMGEAAVAQAPQLGNRLEISDHTGVREEAAKALGQMGEAAAAQAPKLGNLLSTFRSTKVRLEATKALERMGKANNETILSILNAVYGNQGQVLPYRFLAYFLSGGKEEEESIIAIQWLGLYNKPDLTKLDYKEKTKILNAFDEIWEPSQSFPRLRNDLEKQIAKVIKQGTWKFQDIALLTKQYQHLHSVNSTHADAVQAQITQLEGWKWFFDAWRICWRIWLFHFLLWLFLIFAYPKCPQIQAIFFWNPWVRRFMGLGYVSFLITWIPFLRSKLFAPFKKSLLADAKLDYFDLQSYFDKSEVKQKASGKVKHLKEAIPEIKGRIVLQGESGLGKSLFLRHLATDSQRIVVYLSADRCTDGVIKAIQNKLLGKAQDLNFLSTLIYSGAIDICIDGLNEVNADTRAIIKIFVEKFDKGNIIMTTQSWDWNKPTHNIYTVQPLQDDLIREFLLSRQSSLAEDHQLQIQDYEQSCQDYLAKALNPNLSKKELKANKKILSNPMDLTILSQVIASGEEPNLFRLQEQQYELMAADYEDIYGKFPLAKFSEHAYQIRLNNSTISETDFYKELQCMLRHKMVICQQFRNVKDENVTEWKFRHDKIWEFFILQTFLGKDNELPIQHIDDPRFSGVYFLLANLLPLDKAKILREDLIRYAANTGDHTVSDRFIQILLTRQ